jgi:penicillin amidase
VALSPIGAADAVQGATSRRTLGSVAPAPDIPPAQQLTALNVAPPGQSGFFSVAGEALGKATGNPAAYGAHVDDQRLLYWTLGYKPGNFAQPTGRPQRPTPKSRLYRDSYGVPIVYADDGWHLWYATGWAFAQDRLFEMDAIRRLATGRLAELTGPSGVPGDVQARVLGYTDSEYEAMFSELLDGEDQTAVDACVAGINAWIARVLEDPVQFLPAEYALLSSLPEPWQRRDVLASGVFIVLSVASAGGNEMGNVANLLALQDAFPKPAARGVFQDLFWLQDSKAVTTVPAASGRFPNSNLTAAEREDVFEAMADYAGDLPAALANGPGTGAYPAPGDLGTLPQAPDPASSSAQGALVGVVAALHADLPEGVKAGLARAGAALAAWGRSLHGGSYQIAVGPQRTASAKPLLVSGPQLGYSYPSELYELEVHGGGYHARGVTVPGLPVVGIGYGTRIAWALTTGESKTIDTFVETTRPNPNGGPPQYLFNGAWRDQECRSETIYYRPAPGGVPAGPPVESVTVEVCRTHHGPIVATAGTGLASSWAFAIRGQEVRTLSGILRWNRATNLQEFEAGVALTTWNENTMYADADGNIAYWHPGLFPVRSPKVDLRFPTPGTGGYEWEGFLTFDQMPHALNPADGYLANWNTKPSVDWLEEAGTAPGQPAGAAQRVQDITAQIAGRNDMAFADLAAIDGFIGTADHRARALLPLVLSLRGLSGLSATERAALEYLASWDHAAYDPPPGTELGVSADTTDGPAPTIFSAFIDALRRELFGFLPSAVTASDDGASLHLFDVKPIDNLALRVLDASSSALRPNYDYLKGRTPTEVIRAALDQALGALNTQFGTADMTKWRRPHPTSAVCSLTGGVIGPCLTMPFEDRGTYIHHVAFIPS